VKHQVALLQQQPDATALWNIRYFTQFGAQGTCSNEALHSILSVIKPGKATKFSFETLQMNTGIAILNYNSRFAINPVFKLNFKDFFQKYTRKLEANNNCRSEHFQHV